MGWVGGWNFAFSCSPGLIGAGGKSGWASGAAQGVDSVGKIVRWDLVTVGFGVVAWNQLL